MSGCKLLSSAAEFMGTSVRCTLESACWQRKFTRLCRLFVGTNSKLNHLSVQTQINRLISSVLRPAWERNHIPNVLHPSDKHHQSLEPQSKTAMRNASVASQIQVPLQRIARHPQLLNASLIPPLLTYRFSSFSRCSSRCDPPISSPIFGTKISIARTVLPSSFSFI